MRRCTRRESSPRRIESRQPRRVSSSCAPPAPPPTRRCRGAGGSPPASRLHLPEGLHDVRGAAFVCACRLSRLLAEFVLLADRALARHDHRALALLNLARSVLPLFHFSFLSLLRSDSPPLLLSSHLCAAMSIPCCEILWPHHAP